MSSSLTLSLGQKARIQADLRRRVELVFADADWLPDFAIALELPRNPEHGHWASPFAMELYSQFEVVREQFSSPRAVAEAVLQQDGVEETLVYEVAGPGFVNVWLSSEMLQESVEALTQESPLALVPQPMQGKTGVIEFTDPNPFKEFHIGHVYSNIVGESLARLLDTTGAEVKRYCYQGDVGMHVAKSVWGLRELLQQENLTLEQLAQKGVSERVRFLGQAYAHGARASKVDEAAQAEMKEINLLTFKAGQDRLVEEDSWQPQVDYDALLPEELNFDYEEIKSLYFAGRRWSLEYFEAMYRQIGMQDRRHQSERTFDDYFFESLVGEFGLKIVQEHLQEGIFEESQGAVIFPGEKHGLHNRVFINSLGLPTYEAKELGLAVEKQARWPYDFSVIVTGNEIDEYFKVLLKALSLTYPELAAKTTHLSHAMVRLPEGKMSSRTGQVVTGASLLEMVEAEALEQIDVSLPVEDRQARAQAISLGAIKYALLRSNIGKDIVFDAAAEMNFQGDTGPYLQYAVVRCNAVLKNLPSASQDRSYQADAVERQLMHLVSRFDEVVVEARENFAPHLVANYLHDLAQAFSSFYSDHHVAEDHPKYVRVRLTESVAAVLKDGMYLLGIPVLEQM